MRILRYNFRILNHQQPECTLLDAANFFPPARTGALMHIRLPSAPAASSFQRLRSHRDARLWDPSSFFIFSTKRKLLTRSLRKAGWGPGCITDL
jgi:hypothetical protein